MIAEDVNDNDMWTYTARCDADDCTESLPPRGSPIIALMDAIQAGWRQESVQKMSGVAKYLFCKKHL